MEEAFHSLSRLGVLLLRQGYITSGLMHQEKYVPRSHSTCLHADEA
jgi:hypothetical protein